MIRSILRAASRPYPKRHHSNLPQSFTHDTLLANKKVLIANRGEISLRIQRACRALGAKSVAVCAEQDLDSPHVSGADEYVVVDGEGAIGPYLNVKGLTDVCLERGVDLVHPGEFLYAYVCTYDTLYVLTQCMYYSFKLQDMASFRNQLNLHNL